MDEEEDKHLCINCNETIYGLINYVIHRKNSCKVRNQVSDNAGLVNIGSKDFEDSHLKLANALKREAEDSEDVSQFQEKETSLLQGISSRTGLDSETGLFQSNDEESRLSQGSYVETSLQSFENQFLVQASRVENNFQSVSSSVNEQDHIVRQSVKHLNNVPNEVKEVLFSTEERSMENRDSCNRGISNLELANVNETQTSDSEAIPSHYPMKSEYGILSIPVAGECNQETSGSKKNIKIKKEQFSKLDGTQSESKKKQAPRQSNRKRKLPAKFLTMFEEGTSDLYSVSAISRYVVNQSQRNIGETAASDKVCKGDNNFIKVKVEEGTEMLVDQNCKEAEQNEETGRLNNNKFDNDYSSDGEGEDLDYLESDDDTDELNENIDTVKMENSDPAEKNDQTGDTDVVIKAYECTICEKIFTSNQSLMRHLLTPSHKKQTVGKEDEYLSLIKKHHTSSVSLSPYRCDICSFCFNDHRYLVDHLNSKTHREKVAKKKQHIVCTLCNVEADSNESLISHVLSPSHVNRVEKKDRICVIKIGQRAKGPKKQLICNICPEEFCRMTPNRSHFLTKEHNQWKLAFEKKMLNLAFENKEGVCETNLEIKLGTGEKEDTKNEDLNIPQNDFSFDLTDSGKSSSSRNVESGSVMAVTGNSINIDDKEVLDINVSQNSQIGHQVEMETSDQAYSLKRASKCKYCSFETNDYNEMRPHYMKEHAEMVKICEVCNFVFPHGKGYKLHVNSKDHQANIKKFGNESEGKFECHVCKKKFADEGYCKFHTAYYHFHLNTEEDVLKVYGNSVTREKYADYLMEVEKLPNTLELNCPECKAEIKKMNMLGHLRKHTGEKPFICNICTAEFYNSSSLRRHLRVHFDCLVKKCELCGEEFSGLTSYNIHMDIHKAKNTSSEKTNVCHMCGEAFYIKRQLRMHMKKHATKDFRCNFSGCLWAFTDRHALRCHMLTHTDENPFICATCGYKTKSRKYLKSHEKIHSKERFLQCEHCPYQTIKTTHLRRHMRIHLGTKPYKCPYCPYACNTHDNIRKHILETAIHRGMKVYPCKLCNYATNCTKEFRKHLLTVHTEVTAEDIQGASLAAFTGLFSKEEDVQTASEGMIIYPCKERKTSRRKIQPDEESLS